MIVGPCTVVTGGPSPAVLEDAGVHVAGAHIAHVAHLSVLAGSYPDEPLWPAHGRVLLPGFINTHAHMSRHLARGLAMPDLAEWRRYEQALSPEDVYWAALAALVEGVRHGVTTVFDFHRSGACIDLSLSEIVGAATEVGVRVSTCYGVSTADSPAERRAALEECASFADEIRVRRQGTLCGLLGVQATDLSGVDALLREVLDSTSRPLGVHVDLAADRRTVGNDASVWFGAPVPALWAHADAAPTSLLGLARERGDALCCTANGHTSGVPGAAWGSDAGVNAPPAGHGAPSDADAARAHYEHLMVHGPRWGESHFGEGLGRIEPGAPADLVVLDYAPATELTSRTLAAHLAGGMLRAPVTGVMVAGEVVMEDGQMVGVDEREVAARARECAHRVWARLG